MFSVIKACFIIIMQLNIFYLLGAFVSYIKWLPSAKDIISKIIYGYIAYHFMFWCVAFPCSMNNQDFSLVLNIWLVLLIVILVLLFITNGKACCLEYKKIGQAFNNYKFFLIPFIGLVIFLAYFITISGQNDIDAQTYIAEVTTILDTNELVSVRATHGQIVNKIDFRRSFAMYGVESAVWCKEMKLHPLVYCRITRAVINIVMLTIVVLGLFLRVYNGKNRVPNAIMASMLSLASIFLFRNTIYTSARFILYRAYEGKAFCAGVLILIAIYLATEFVRERDSKYFILFFMNMIMTMSLSTSSVLIIPVVIGSIVGSVILLERRLNYIPKLVLAMSPNIIYIVILLSGVTYWRLW